MRAGASLLVAVPVLCLPLAGCQRLNDERTIRVTAGAIQSIGYSAPAYEQKVTVHLSAGGAPLSACLVRAEDREAAEAALEKEKMPAATLAALAKGEDISLEATVPAKTAYVLVIRADKKTADVHIQVNGR